ncbi:MAG: hypothetical protein IAE91_07130 [Ignavibacteriaceae bacterium]|nr:hypothetical protein [Ignavibacteriaceae bacterium]
MFRIFKAVLTVVLVSGFISSVNAQDITKHLTAAGFPYQATDYGYAVSVDIGTGTPVQVDIMTQDFNGKAYYFITVYLGSLSSSGIKADKSFLMKVADMNTYLVPGFVTLYDGDYLYYLSYLWADGMTDDNVYYTVGRAAVASMEAVYELVEFAE